MCAANGKRYIGSSVDAGKRWSAHVRALNRGTHRNRHLQGAWQAYGPCQFSFAILEFCPADQRIIQEEKWIVRLNTYDQRQGFNIRAPDRRSVSDETRALLSLSHKGQTAWNKGLKCPPRDPAAVAKGAAKMRGRKMPPTSAETRAKMSAAKKGKPPHNLGKSPSDESRAKMSAAKKDKKQTAAHAANSANARRGLKRSPMTKAARAKIAAAKRGKPLSAEHRAAISAAHQRNQKKRPPVTNETRARMRNSRLAHLAKQQNLC